MEIIGATEARANFAELLQRVSTAGERIAIERRGKPVVALVPIDSLGLNAASNPAIDPQGWENPQGPSSARLEETERLAKLGHWEWDEIENRCTYCSEGLARLAGVTAEEYLERTSSFDGDVAWAHPEDRDRYRKAVTEAVTNRSSFAIEYRFVRANGEIIHVYEESSPVLDENGVLVASRGFVQDISERKGSEEALRQSEALLSQSMRTARMGAWVWDDAKDESVYCSEELALLFGQSVEEYLATRAKGPGVTAFIHPDDRAHYQECIEESVAAGSRYHVEFRERVADGTYRHFREVGEPRYGESAQQRISMGVVQDITELRDTERALRLSEAALIRAQHQAHIGSWRWDVPGNKLIACSGEYARIHGVDLDEIPELLNHQLERVIHPDDRDRVEVEFKRFDKEGIDYQIEYRIVRPDGEVRHVLEIGETLLDDNGRAVEQIGTVQDITERKRAEEALRQAHGELEQRVEMRTAELREANEALKREIAEHKKTEKALSKTEALMRALIEHSPVALSIKELDGRYSFVSPAYTRYLDMSADEAAGKSARDILSPDTIALLEAADQAVMSSGEALRFDQAFTAEFGSATLLVTKFPIQDHDGRIISIGTVGVDVTEQERAEEALRKNEEYLRALVEASPSAIFLKDPEGRYVVINSAYEELLGMSREDIIGKTLRELDILDEGYVEEITELDHTVLRTAEVIHREHHPVLPDGRTPTTMLTKFPIFGSDRRPVGVGAMETDITEQKEAEKRLRESEERLRQTTQLAKIGYYEWDAVEDRCLFCSDEHARIHGLSPDEYIARASTLDGELSLTHPDDRGVIERAIKDLRNGKPIEIEYRTITPSGETHHLREIIEPVLDEAGRVVLEIGASQDVTALHQAEARLAQAQKMESVGQLTGGVAHDFNNLLAVIQGNAELLIDKDASDASFTDPIIRATTRGSELTQRLLAFSRQQALAPQAIDLGALVSGMSDLLTRTLGETIEIEIGRPPNLRNALADPGQVENALLNLAINARDAMPEGGKLTIECQNARLDEAYVAQNPEAVVGDYIVLAVSDSGTGMSAEIQAHVFEPFFTTKEVGKGSGLGLSMVYGFAKQSGGQVTIYSEQDRGTTVKIYLPCAEGDAQGEEKNQSGDIPLGLGETILVIEDDADVRALAVKMLESLGYRTTSVSDAASARATLADGVMPDLVLSDVVLPGGISGPEFAETACETYPDLKVIFMSGYPAEAAKRNGFLGSDMVLLNKPFQRQQLAKALREALD